MARLTAQDIRGIYAMMPTPATPNASMPTTIRLNAGLVRMLRKAIFRSEI